MLTPAEAAQLIEQNLASLPEESLPLAQCAGAVLRENVYAERDQPPFDRVAMDGIALDSRAVEGGTRALRIQGMQAAGDPPQSLSAPGACIEVMTGAVLPEGCDTVIPVEQVIVRGAEAKFADDLAVRPWQNVHRRGSDTRAGALLLSIGLRLAAPEIAIAAGAGMARIRVTCQPTVAVVSTGNELIEPGEPILPHQVRRSNAYAILAALKRQGLQRIADDHVRDDPEDLAARLRLHLHTHDVLILSGGVSMGRLDLVPQALSALQVRTVFHKVAQRPGLPLWFGVAASGAAVFALPGNPVSTLVCAARYVLPALLTLTGAAPRPPERVALASAVAVKQPLALFMPVRITIDDSGRPWAQPQPTNGSGDFTALAGTDGVVELPPGPHTYGEGFVTSLYRW